MKIKKVYSTTHKIRGKNRRVEVTVWKNGKRQVRIIDSIEKKKDKYLSIPKNVARMRNSMRTLKSRKLDAKTTSKKVITDERWLKNPEKYDYPNIDTKGSNIYYAGEKKNKKKQTKKQKIRNIKEINSEIDEKISIIVEKRERKIAQKKKKAKQIILKHLRIYLDWKKKVYKDQKITLKNLDYKILDFTQKYEGDGISFETNYNIFDAFSWNGGLYKKFGLKLVNELKEKGFKPKWADMTYLDIGF